jgi:RNA polymerase sigma factor (sigma-70 family)
MGHVVYLSTEGEQNRRIIGFMHIIEPIASGYRGVKGIPFADLLSEGRVALTSAARRFRVGDFENYAAVSIRNAIRRFIKEWEVFESLDKEKKFERDYYEWKIYPDLALYEGWTSLDATPEDILIAYDVASKNASALQTAIQFLGLKEREIINARFFRKPPQTIDSIAREQKMSYAATVRLIAKTLESLKDVVQSREAATPSATRG